MRVQPPHHEDTFHGHGFLSARCTLPCAGSTNISPAHFTDRKPGSERASELPKVSQSGQTQNLAFPVCSKLTPLRTA